MSLISQFFLSACLLLVFPVMFFVSLIHPLSRKSPLLSVNMVFAPGTSWSSPGREYYIFLELHLAVLIHVQLVDGSLGRKYLDHLERLLLGEKPTVVQVQLGVPLT